MTKYVARQGFYDDGKVFVEVSGVAIKELPLRLDLANKSPTGFAWGYEGSGPAQLAIAILAHATGDDRLAGDPRAFQTFKRQVIAALPQGEGFTIDKESVLEFVRELQAESATP